MLNLLWSDSEQRANFPRANCVLTKSISISWKKNVRFSYEGLSLAVEHCCIVCSYNEAESRGMSKEEEEKKVLNSIILFIDNTFKDCFDQHLYSPK